MNRIGQMQSYMIVLVMLMMFASIGCQRESTLESANIDALSTDAFAVADFSDFDANIQDATLEKDMTMDPVIGSNGGFVRDHGRLRGGPGGPGGHHQGPHQCGHLGFILRELQVTVEQREAIKELIRSHHETVKEYFDALREANLDILEQAKANRHAILDALKNGDITREEADAQLQALNESTRQAIQENPENLPLLEAICSAKLELFDNVRALLDETQAATWDDWVAGLEDPCFQ